MRWIILGLALGITLAWHDSHAQDRARGHNQVACWYVPNGLNVTMLCQNGWWTTTTPEGEVFEGNGMEDPNALATGGTFNINPTTGGPNIDVNRGAILRPANQPPVVGPGQAEAYGFQTRWD